VGRLVPGLGRGESYLWGGRPVVIAAADIVEHIGWAPPELRALFVRNQPTLDPAVRRDFLRLRADEVDEAMALHLDSLAS